MWELLSVDDWGFLPHSMEVLLLLRASFFWGCVTNTTGWGKSFLRSWKRGKKKKSVTKFVVPYIRFGGGKTGCYVPFLIVWRFCSCFYFGLSGFDRRHLFFELAKFECVLVVFSVCVHRNRCNAQFAPSHTHFVLLSLSLVCSGEACSSSVFVKLRFSLSLLGSPFSLQAKIRHLVKTLAPGTSNPHQFYFLQLLSSCFYSRATVRTFFIFKNAKVQLCCSYR